MSPETAAARALSEIRADPRIRIVAVSGPGEPLANPETFETFELIRDSLQDVNFCLSTNGTMLSEHVPWLKKMGFMSVTVSMSTSNPSSAARIYEWAEIAGRRLTGDEMGLFIIRSQLHGISKAADARLPVKVNSILIPEINKEDIVRLAELVAEAGASLQNIVPLVPNGRFASLTPPSRTQLEDVRKRASVHIVQFRHCKQCRSDVMGIPGCDVIL